MTFNLFNEVGDMGIPFSYTDDKKDSKAIFEAAADTTQDAANLFSAQQLKSQGMSCVLSWIDSGDFSADNLDTTIQYVADLDGDGEVQPGGDEEAYYNDLYSAAADAMAYLGADPDQTSSFIDDGDPDAGSAIGGALADKVGALEQSDDEIISDYTLAPSDQILESGKFVIRGGVKMFKKKRLHRMKLSGAQKSALRHARLKAHSSVANRNRLKSFRKGKKMGLHS